MNATNELTKNHRESALQEPTTAELQTITGGKGYSGFGPPLLPTGDHVLVTNVIAPDVFRLQFVEPQRQAPPPKG
jgi:hypothetical protein